MTHLSAKTERITKILEKTMGLPGSKPRHADPLKSLVLTILSQNTSDINSFKAFRSLEETCGEAEGEMDWRKIALMPREKLANIIRSGGLANQKSERIRNVLRWLKEEYGDYRMDFICGMEPMEAVELFTRHKGIGVKTVSIVLAFSCAKDVFPVDTHVKRICHRLGLVSEKLSAEKTFWAMRELVPKGKSLSLHVNMIRLGRETCRSRNPKCEECPLAQECEYRARQDAG